MDNNKIFVYGILKRGYELDLEQFGAKFLGEASIPGATLYGIGRRYQHEGHPNDGREFSGVGLKLAGSPLTTAYGELWEIPDNLWNFLDDIEQNGQVYERKIVPIVMNVPVPEDEIVPAGTYCKAYTNAWVYEHCFKNFHYKDIIVSGRF